MSQTSCLDKLDLKNVSSQRVTFESHLFFVQDNVDVDVSPTVQCHKPLTQTISLKAIVGKKEKKKIIQLV
jgi:hypothetical protein